MNLFEWMKTFVEDYRAWRRGEKRVAPRGTRGRVYAPRNPKIEYKSAGGVRSAKSKASARLHMKIMRKDGSVEYREAPAHVIKEENLNG